MSTVALEYVARVGDDSCAYDCAPKKCEGCNVDNDASTYDTNVITKLRALSLTSTLAIDGRVSELHAVLLLSGGCTVMVVAVLAHDGSE